MKYLSFLFALISSQASAQFITNTGITITNNTKVQTDGAWQNSGTFRNNGTIITSEAWQNTGTLDPASTGGFVLQYATTKAFSTGSNSAKMGFLRKEGAGDVTLSGRVMVKDSLRILSGIIKMSTANDTLAISLNTLVNVSSTSYVDGPMARFGSGTFSLPLGLDGNYLPVKFYNSTSARVGAAVNLAPAGYVPGDAVGSLFGFPYVWKTTKANASDTARYVEVSSPDALLGLDNIIVTRQTSGTNQYEAMGTKTSSSSGGFTSYKSYDRGLKGVFSLGIGYSGDAATDSLELVNLFDSTSNEPTHVWLNKSNWKTGEVITWHGITQKGGRVTAIDLSDNRLEGFVPSTFINLSALKSLDLSGNWEEGLSDGINSIPDLTGMNPPLTVVNVSGNNLDFEDLEVNASLIVSDIGFYENQAPLTDSVYSESPVGDPYPLQMPETVGGTPANTSYQWKFKAYYGGTNYVDAPGSSDTETYTIPELNRSTIGKYKLEVKNSAVPNLVLASDVFEVEAVADISGVLKFGDAGVQPSNRPSVFKELRLLQITGGGYDTIREVSVGVDGAYLFNDVKLRDYLINGFADTVFTQYEKAIPTWYTQTFLWEEADTLVLISDTTNLDIATTIRPDHPTGGFGAITGSFYETVSDEGGKINGKNRVRSSGVSVRRVEETGRGEAELLTLVDYVFTNDEGEFTFNFLDEAEYRLNLQYPGYPMDETSFITIPIADNLFERQVGIEAEVIAGKIFVRKLIITGWEEAKHSMTAYPNPTAEYLFIKGMHDQLPQFKMVDSNGRNVNVNANWENTMKQWIIDVREVKPGAYILQVMKQDKVEKLRVMVR